MLYTTIISINKYTINIDNKKYIINNNFETFIDVFNNICKKRNVIELDYNTFIIKTSDREYLNLLRNIKKF